MHGNASTPANIGRDLERAESVRSTGPATGEVGPDRDNGRVRRRRGRRNPESSRNPHATPQQKSPPPPTCTLSAVTITKCSYLNILLCLRRLAGHRVAFCAPGTYRHLHLQFPGHCPTRGAPRVRNRRTRPPSEPNPRRFTERHI